MRACCSKSDKLNVYLDLICRAVPLHLAMKSGKMTIVIFIVTSLNKQFFFGKFKVHNKIYQFGEKKTPQSNAFEPRNSIIFVSHGGPYLTNDCSKYKDADHEIYGHENDLWSSSRSREVANGDEGLRGPIKTPYITENMIDRQTSRSVEEQSCWI